MTIVSIDHESALRERCRRGARLQNVEPIILAYGAVPSRFPESPTRSSTSYVTWW